MKLQEKNTLVIDKVSNDNSEVLKYESKIDPKNLGKLYAMLSAPYKNPIASIVREITSNCFDSHTEAGTEDAVHIKMGNDNGGAYISFIDFGLGMSPTVIKDIYSNYLTSTKEETNDLLGCFGIGSKSPLSYTNVFHIITNSEGTQYHYIMHKGKDAPSTELLTSLPTTEPNGTEIKIYIKNSSDVRSFTEELKNQLCYFDNIYYTGTDLKNDFIIYEKDNFIYRPEFQYKSTLHLVIGNVVYPIDWDIIGMHPIDIPFAVKFDIGELMVTPSREDIKYSEDTKQDGEIIKGSITLIKERINATLTEIETLYNKQKYQYDTIDSYNKARYNAYSKELKLGVHSVNISNSVSNKLTLNKIEFTPLKGYNATIPQSNYYGYYTNRKIANGRLYVCTETNLDNIIKYNNVIYLDDNHNKKVNKYLSEIQDSTFIIKRKKLTLKTYIDILKLKKDEKHLWREIITIYQNCSEDLLFKHVPKYKEIVIPDDWEEEKILLNYNSIRKQNKEIVIKEIYKTGRINKKDIKIHKLVKYKGILLYGEYKDRKQLKTVLSYLQNTKLYKKLSYDVQYKFVKCIALSKRNQKYIENNKNSYNLTDIKNGELKLLNKIMIANSLYDNTNVPYNRINDLIDIFPKNNIVYKTLLDIKELNEFITNYTSEYYYDDSELRSLLKNDSTFYVYLNILHKHSKLNKLFEDTPLIKRIMKMDISSNITLQNEIIEYITNFLK